MMDTIWWFSSQIINRRTQSIRTLRYSEISTVYSYPVVPPFFSIFDRLLLTTKHANLTLKWWDKVPLITVLWCVLRVFEEERREQHSAAIFQIGLLSKSWIILRKLRNLTALKTTTVEYCEVRRKKKGWRGNWESLGAFSSESKIGIIRITAAEQQSILSWEGLLPSLSKANHTVTHINSQLVLNETATDQNGRSR